MKVFRSGPSVVRSTVRLEAYSDAVIAIIITLLVLELRVPELEDQTVVGVLHSLTTILPQLLSFAFSFLTLSVFWVNHHHFYHEVDRTDGRLMWYNNALLFWLALIPFTTAYLGEHPFVPGVIMLYCFVLFMAALMYTLMTRHAIFVAKLVHFQPTDEQKCQIFYRSLTGISCYGIATLIAPFVPIVSMVIMVFVPFYFIAPRLLHDHVEGEA